MFRSARWRSEKNKIKAVFKLQFHATQVQQLGVDALMVSVVPGDVGKPTVRLEKAMIRDGSCRWENPVYETVKFIREPKTGKINERIFYFLVSTGSSKAGLIGEVSIDFADYAEATKTSTISLPLKNSNSNAFLHVTIQRLLTNADNGEIEEIEDEKIKSQDRSLKTQLSNGDIDEDFKNDSAEDGLINKTTHIAKLNGNHRASSGSDITISSSESSSGLDTPRELGLRNNNIHDLTNSLSSLSHLSVHSKQTANASTTIYEEREKSQWEWPEGSEHGISMDDSINNSQEALPRERSQQPSDNEMERLKAELADLARHADLSEMELQTLRKQIVKEGKRGQDLSREVVSLKEERDALRAECENFKAFQKRMDEAKVKNKLQLEGRDLHTLVEEIRQELNYEKDLNSNLRLQLQKTQESNAELILAVQDLDELLEQKSREISDLSSKLGSCENAEETRGTFSRCETDDDEEQKALEELVKEHRDAKESYLLEQKIIDLYSEIEIYRRDKDDLEMHMEQLALDYEILKQENHDMSYKLDQTQLREQLKIQYECSSSFANINELEFQNESLENELKRQSEEYSDSLATIKELESHINSLEIELKKQSEEYSYSLATIKELESHINSLENELKKQSEECSDFLATIKELESHIKSLEKELKEQSEEYSDSLVTIKELESNIRSMENELKKQSREYSDSLVIIRELESHNKSLEEELEKQTQGFEADLEAITCAKVEQEQRAIRAEEALRMARWKNGSAAERLQEEFKRLSVQMASAFCANEEVAMKAMKEASELRKQKSQLEELLQKANEELQSVREDYEAKLLELSNQIDLKTTQLEQLLLEIDGKSEQLEHQLKHEDEVSEAFSQEILTLKAEIERLITENKFLNEEAEEKENMRAELEQMRTSSKETEMLIQKENGERNELITTIDLMKKEAEKSQKELNRMSRLKDETETTVGVLRSESETLKSRCNDLKHSLLEDESEKEKLRKQVFQLKGDLKKKEDAFISIEKRLKDSNARAAVSDGPKTTLKSNKSVPVPRSSKDVTSLKEKIKLLEGQIKLKETALETSTNSFLEKENDLQHKIEELECRVEQLNQNTSSFCKQQCQEVSKDESDHNSNGDITEEVRSTAAYLISTGCLSKENGNAMSLNKSYDDILSQKKLRASRNKDGNLDNLSTELTSLKERNKSMENELKEMQERYSEISLKFAEVEGERQQLVMTVRNLKNAKKS